MLFRPSSAPALKLCVHYKSSSMGSADATLGTQMHKRFEGRMIGQEVEPGPDMKVQHVEACDDCASVTISKIQEITKLPYNKEQTTLEEKVVVTANDLSIITSGTGDVIHSMPKDVEYDILIDGKGCLDFDIENHYHKPQLASYALGWMQRSGKRKMFCIEAYMMPSKLVCYWLTYDEAAAIIGELVARIEQKNKLPRQPNWHCKNCADLLGCPALNEQIAIVEKNFAAIGDWILDIELVKDPQKMAIAYNFAKIMDKFHERIQKAAKALSDEHADDEAFIPGFKRKEKKGEVKITNINEAFNLSGLSADAFSEACKISIPTLADKYRETFGGTKKAARAAIDGALLPVITPGKPSYYLQQIQNETSI